MVFFLSPKAEITIECFPFNHVTILNAFEPLVVENLESVFNRNVAKSAPIGKVGETGEYFYSAVNYTPDLLDINNSAISILASNALRELVCSILNVQTVPALMLGSHRHNPPSRDGWIHTDCAIVSFPPDGPRVNGFNVFQPNTGCNYSDDSRDRQPTSLKLARSVACLYYFGNRDWQQGDGGETALFAIDRMSPVKKVAPIHNTLLAFEISPVSFHSYQACPNHTRDSFIWWYHSNVSWMEEHHSDKFTHRRLLGEDPWDRWTDAATPKFDSSESNQ